MTLQVFINKHCAIKKRLINKITYDIVVTLMSDHVITRASKGLGFKLLNRQLWSDSETNTSRGFVVSQVLFAYHQNNEPYHGC